MSPQVNNWGENNSAYCQKRPCSCLKDGDIFFKKNLVVEEGDGPISHFFGYAIKRIGHDKVR